MKINLRILDNKYFLLSVLFLLVFFFYLPGKEGRLTSDFYNWVRDYKTGGIAELWTCFGYPGLHQLYHLPFYFSYQFFGLNSMAWHIEFTLLHAINGVLVYYLAKEMITIVGKNPKFAFIASFLFILSPFQTEVVGWGATIHYLLVVLLFLLAFLFLIKYLKTGSNKYLVLFHILYSLDLLTMELPLVFPAIFVIYALVTMDYYNLRLKDIFLKILLIHILTIIVYFIATKLVIGSFIGHYGAENHLSFTVKKSSDTLYNYFLKFIFFYRYISGEGNIRKILFDIFNNDVFRILTFITPILILTKNHLLKKKKTSVLSFILLNLVFFTISLLPVINIEMNSLLSLTTDRYSYVASIFFMISITILISSLPKKLAIIISFSYLTLNIVLLVKTVNIWKETGILFHSIIDSYNFAGEEVYAINNIKRYNGAYLFQNGFKAAINLHRGEDINLTYHDIAKVFSTSLIDSVTLDLETNRIEATVIPWGRWFWIKESNTKYNARLGKGGQSVIIEPKEKIKIIYLNKGVWEEVFYD